MSRLHFSVLGAAELLKRVLSLSTSTVSSEGRRRCLETLKVRKTEQRRRTTLLPRTRILRQYSGSRVLPRFFSQLSTVPEGEKESCCSLRKLLDRLPWESLSSFPFFSPFFSPVPSVSWLYLTSILS